MTQANNQLPSTGSESSNAMTGGRVTGIHRNCLNTISFDGKFSGMRKAQEFIVYPVKGDDSVDRVKVQSDTRIGWVTMTGEVLLCPPKPGGAYAPDLAKARKVDQLNAEELFLFKAQVFATGSVKGGNEVLSFDNSGALDLFSGDSK